MTLPWNVDNVAIVTRGEGDGGWVKKEIVWHVVAGVCRSSLLMLLFTQVGSKKSVGSQSCGRGLRRGEKAGKRDVLGWSSGN